MTLPRHIAIIPDGNRRWAKQHAKLAFFGHRAGSENIETILAEALSNHIPYITIWGCSVDNITKRDPQEIAFLLQIFKHYFKKLSTDPIIQKNKVRISALGQWKTYFPPDVSAAIVAAEQATEHHTQHTLTILLAYNGNEEMRTAIAAITQAGETTISDELIKNHLYTKDLPAVDLVIRTGGDPHFSNGFMMWDTQNAELFFTEKTWPDFTPADFQAALHFFENARRKLGS